MKKKITRAYLWFLIELSIILTMSYVLIFIRQDFLGDLFCIVMIILSLLQLIFTVEMVQWKNRPKMDIEVPKED